MVTLDSLVDIFPPRKLGFIRKSEIRISPSRHPRSSDPRYQLEREATEEKGLGLGELPKQSQSARQDYQATPKPQSQVQPEGETTEESD